MNVLDEVTFNRTSLVWKPVVMKGWCAWCAWSQSLIEPVWYGNPLPCSLRPSFLFASQSLIEPVWYGNERPR